VKKPRELAEKYKQLKDSDRDILHRERQKDNKQARDYSETHRHSKDNKTHRHSYDTQVDGHQRHNETYEQSRDTRTDRHHSQTHRHSRDDKTPRHSRDVKR